MYEELLMLSRADQLELVVTDGEVDRGIRDMYQNMGIQTEREFVQALEETGTNLDSFRERWRDRLLMQQVVGADVQSRLQIAEEELRRYYRDHPEEFRIPEQLRLQEVIILESGPLAGAEREQLVEEVRTRLIAGEDLDTIIQPHQENGETSGVIELGWVKPGELATVLEEAIWELPAGTVSEPVEARGGTHLVQVLERTESKLQPFSEVSEQILIREQNRRFAEEFEGYVAELEAKAEIVVDPPPEARNFRAASAGVAEDVLEGVGTASAQDEPDSPDAESPDPVPASEASSPPG
jgi:parvulin-like peptidyl-prolyl isomerase